MSDPEIIGWIPNTTYMSKKAFLKCSNVAVFIFESSQTNAIMQIYAARDTDQNISG